MFNLNNFDFFADANIALASSISTPTVADLLKTKGWILFESTRDFESFRRPKEEPEQYVVDLPKKEGTERPPKILDAALAIALFEKRPIVDVLNEWKNPRVDRVKFRIISERVADGSAPLFFVQKLVDGILGTLRASLKDVESPSRLHKRAFSSRVDELMKRAEFGQTEKGSYVVNVKVPLNALDDDGRFDETKDLFFRKALEHVVKTLDFASRSSELDSDPARVLESTFGASTSANLLDALFETTCDGKADLNVVVDWSPLVPYSSNAPSSVYFKKERAAFLKTWAQAARPKDREEKGTFRALVVSLTALKRDAKDERPSGIVVFRILKDDGSSYDAETFLNADDFQTAYEALAPNDELSFEGRVFWKNGKPELSNVASLRSV